MKTAVKPATGSRWPRGEPAPPEPREGGQGMNKYGILVQDDQGNQDVVVCNSQVRAEQLREVMETKGIETYGMIRVVPYTEVLLGGRYR